ncbi:MAG: hypothetical protein M1836_000212 [Candelina mexicana]|nr:MAG: hypothetical protein M1836_000212 [Candelina mexicana]
MFLVVNGVGLVTGAWYNNSTPDLYESNAHHKIGWVLTWIIGAQALMAVLTGHTRLRDASVTPKENGSLVPISINSIALHQEDSVNAATPEHRYSNDSGQGTERASSSLRSHSLALSDDSERQGLIEPCPLPEYHQGDEVGIGSGMQLGSFRGFIGLRNSPLTLYRLIPKRLLHALAIAYTVLERLILVLGFVALSSGVVTYGGIMRGNHIFNGLAHFVKGGIFFWYGLLTLGRWMGSFADLGWAWNIKPSKHIVGKSKASAPSPEFVESLVIFLYGSSNVFLEHLAAWGDIWTAQDLEHVSISVMFLGGGLCGMLIESTKIRELSNLTFYQQSDRLGAYESHDEWQEPKTYRFAMNPLPGLIILLLGLMMSSHHQSSMASTMLHKQWGTLLVGFSLARAVTYIVFYLSPPASLLPSRPPSELVASFCLISGGLVFMASNKDTVAAMNSHGLDAMFIFTLTMGLTALLMAWTMLVLSVKGWAVRHESRRSAKMLVIKPAH